MLRNKKIVSLILLSGILTVGGVFYFKNALLGSAQVISIFNNSWNIVCADKKPHIQLLSPNGGEKFLPESEVLVKWRSCNIPKTSRLTVSLAYSDPYGEESGSVNLTTGTIGSPGTVNDGTERVTLLSSDLISRNNYLFGNYYKISLRSIEPDLGPRNFEDSSNQFFTITKKDFIYSDSSEQLERRGDVDVIKTSADGDCIRIDRRGYIIFHGNLTKDGECIKWNPDSLKTTAGGNETLNEALLRRAPKTLTIYNITADGVSSCYLHIWKSEGKFWQLVAVGQLSENGKCVY